MYCQLMFVIDMDCRLPFISYPPPNFLNFFAEKLCVGLAPSFERFSFV